MVRERSESGQYVETVTLDDVLGVFDQVRGPVITSSDVAEALDCTTEAARQKLTRLADRGEVDRRKTGRTVVWWRADEPAGPSGPQEETDAEGPDGRTDTPALDDVLAAWEPDTQADTSTARAQTRRAAAWLRSEGGRHTKSDLVDALAGASELGERSWWERAVQPGLRELADAGLVEFRRGHHDYRWTGGDDE